MKIKYYGPKPLISSTGIEFDTTKEDKYVYLNIALQLNKALQHDYFEDKTYFYDVNTQRLSEYDMEKEVEKICKGHEDVFKHYLEHTQEEIEHQLQRTYENTLLNEEDKAIWRNNIELMSEYILQRSYNKTAYYCIINELAKRVKEEHIDYIVVPMYQKFVHVLHSIQGVLTKQNHPIDTKIDYYEKDNQLFAKMKVVNIV